MIVPSTRLLWLSAFTLLPLTTLLTAVEALTLPVAISLTLGALIAVADALASRSPKQFLALESREVLRLSVNRPGTFPLELSNRLDLSPIVRLALVLPRGLSSRQLDWIGRLGPDQKHRVSWPIEGRLRGRWPIRSCRLEIASRLGLWKIRAEYDLGGEVRVYPNLMQDRKSLAPFFLRRGQLGTHTRRQVGRGRDFEKLRDYLPGDSIDDIHWKASARRNQLVTKEYQVERTQEVIVLVDASRLSAKQTGGESNLEKRIRAALLLALATRQYGDHFGLITFGDRIQKYLPPRGGSAHFQSCREALYTLDSQGVSPDFVEVATFLRTRFRRRALLIFLTDLSDPALAEDFLRSSMLLGRDHVVLVCSLISRDVALLFSQPATTDSDLYHRLAGHLVWKRLQDLSGALRQRGVNLVHLPSETFSADVIGRYLRVKERQLL